MPLSQNLFNLLVLLALATAMAGGLLALSYFAGPRGRKATDLSPYECGSKPFEPARRRFTVKFYLIAMLFILFDIETVFLYPWAVELKKHVGGPGAGFVFGEMVIFLAIVVIGFAYAWGRGALDWDR